MNDVSQPVAHLPEDELIRHLDGELDASEREQLLAHLAECGACAERLDTLRLQSQAASELIARVPVPALSDFRRARMRAVLKAAQQQDARRHTRPRRWMLRAAATGTVVFTAALAAEPVRTWIAERWDELSPRTESSVNSPATLSAREAGPRITFEAAGEVFRLELVHSQRQGTLTLRMEDGEVASAQVIGGTGDILVLPDGIRIANQPDSSADYLVTLPAHLGAIHLRVGIAQAVTIRPNLQTLVFDLGGGEPRE